MTATVTDDARPLRAARRPTLTRLTEVELRKMADTRAGLALLIVMALLAAALVTLTLFFADPPDLTFWNLFTSALLPFGLLLPVLGILLVTSEWTQRTALTTFALVPERERIAAAKLAAAVVIGLASVVVSLAAAAAGNVLGRAFFDGDGSWALGWTRTGTATLAQLLNIVMGVGFGLLLINTALAIVLYYGIPIVWGILGSTITALAGTNRWLNLGETQTPLFENGMTGVEWARLGTSAALWIALPLALGVARLLRREVS